MIFLERSGTLGVLVLWAISGCGGGDGEWDAGDLQVPSGLAVTAVFPTSVELRWRDTSDNEDGFAIERCQGAVPYVEIGQVPADMVVFVDDTVEPETTYSYRVFAYAGGSQSAYSLETTVSTPPAPIAPPLSPGGLSVAAISAHQVGLYWVDDSGDETGFRIERSLAAGSGYQQIGTTAADVDVFTDTENVAAETTYYYRVCAYNDAGFSEYSNEAAVTTPPEPVTVPSAPTSLFAAAVSATKINLQWTDNSEDETGFTIERGTTAGGPYTQVASVLADVTMYSDGSNLSPDTAYYYRVLAFNSVGKSNPSNEALARTLPLEYPPLSPDMLVAVARAIDRIDLSWRDNSINETGFRIERRAATATVFASIGTVLANVRSYSDRTGLLPSTQYVYRVAAYNTAGDSAYSNQASATTPAPPVTLPSAPTNLAAAAVSASQVNLSWRDNSSNESGFRIERSLYSGTGFAEIAAVGVNVTAYSDVSGLSPSTTYYYRVRAYNSAGTSAYSNVAGATTGTVQQSQIIADHTIVSRYTAIPQRYIDEVKKMWFNLQGESHSRGYRNGLRYLFEADSRFPVVIVETGAPTPYRTDALRANRALRNEYDNWSYGTGEEIWYTNSTGKTQIKNHVTYCETNNLHIAAIGFGWCWDMTWHDDPGGALDPVYRVRWAGSSVGGPEGDLRWGLDADDRALTGNSVCMDTYLAATEEYIAHCAAGGYTTKVLFTTGPVDGYTGESGVQRHIKHEYLREYTNAEDSRILFDYADILAWNNAGQENLRTWTDADGNVREYQMIHPDNMLNFDGSSADNNDTDADHIGEVGALRLGKAAWWLLARISGWDGVSAN